MKAAALTRRFEFVLHHPDNLVRVDRCEDRVVIRAQRDNFSEERKCQFIRELAAEGFIPDRLQYIVDLNGQLAGVQWIIDGDWALAGVELARAAKARVLRVVLAAGLIWVTLMGLLVEGWL